MHQDKRSAERAPIVARVEAQAGGFPFIVMAQNISVGGALFRTANPVPEGERVHLKFTLPGAEREIRVTGTVQHVTPGEFMGVQFNDLEPADLEAIKQFMETL